MDRMIHLALNSLKALRVDQRINAQNLANIQVPGFKKDMPVTRSGLFLTAMDQYNSRIFVSTESELKSRPTLLLSTSLLHGKIILQLKTNTFGRVMIQEEPFFHALFIKGQRT